MRRLLERLTGKDNQQPQNTENQEDPDKKIELKEIIDNEAHYELDDDDKQYIQNVQQFEHEKAKLWTKPDFQSHLLVYTKLKYNKALTLENLSSYRVYKRLYNDKIKNSKDLSIYEKVLFHPDLTQLDYEFIQAENRKVVRNAGIIELVAIGGLGYCYFKTNLRQQKGFYAVFLLAPAFALFGGFALERYRFRRKLFKVELDKKYQIPT